MPELNRRGVIAAGLGVAGLATLVAVSGPAQARTLVSRALPTVSLAPLQRSVFTPAVGQSFSAKSATAGYTLSLIEILDLPHLSAGHADSCFSLVFSALEGANPPDGVYLLSNSTAGDHELFISRIGTTSGTRELQAVINQSVLVL